jgi:hypothetical protein
MVLSDDPIIFTCDWHVEASLFVFVVPVGNRCRTTAGHMCAVLFDCSVSNDKRRPVANWIRKPYIAESGEHMACSVPLIDRAYAMQLSTLTNWAFEELGSCTTVQPYSQYTQIAQGI